MHWRDNQSGCKGVCDGLPHENTSQHVGQNPLCHEGQCWDEILLAGFEQKMAQLATGTPPRSHLWVLHQLGNHGPAYYKRYPPAYDQFQPACQQEDLSRCTLEQTVNAYDNAVIYTDTVLSRLLQTLQQQQEAIDSVVIYVSDHGESLGEKNLYLHGVPYWMAPEQQTRVPMFLWFSKHAAQTTGTSLHQPEWDLLTQCQTRS